jgi:hypothetical protein
VTLQPVGSARSFRARMDAPGIAVLASSGGDDALAPGAREARTKDAKARAVRTASVPVIATDEDRAARRARDERARGFADLADQKLAPEGTGGGRSKKAAAPAAKPATTEE